jgi:hypothetical protein
MILKRCPSCRTLCDAERDARCFACGGNLSKDGPPVKARVPEVLRTSRRDRKTSSVLHVTFGVLGAFFVVINPTIEPLLRFILGMLLVAAVILGALSAVMKGTLVEPVARSLLKLFAFFGILILGGAALVIGLLILLFVACASGLMR